MIYTLCPICSKPLSKEKTSDFCCRNDDDDHFYGQRVNKDDIDIIKIRITDFDTKFYIKISYKDNYSKIWSSESYNRITINQIINFDDFSIENIKTKIKTYILFS